MNSQTSSRGSLRRSSRRRGKMGLILMISWPIMSHRRRIYYLQSHRSALPQSLCENPLLWLKANSGKSLIKPKSICMRIRRRNTSFSTLSIWNKSSGNLVRSMTISISKTKTRAGCSKSWTSSTPKRLNLSRFSAILSKINWVWNPRKWTR